MPNLSDFGLSVAESATVISIRSARSLPSKHSAIFCFEVLPGELSFEQLRLTNAYSLGIVAFEMLVEEEPFEGQSVEV